jgi:hypothetical protein
MKEMMTNLRKYVRNKKLKVNVKKTKMMMFNKKKRRRVKRMRGTRKEGK